jgi:hypothetical protein
MANRPDSDNLHENVLEIYDESVHPDESLAWLIADEDLALLDNLPQRVSQGETAHNTQPSVQCIDSPVFAHTSASLSIRLSDGLHLQSNPKRTFFRLAAVVAVLLIGSALPSIIERLHPARVKASPALESQASAVTKNAKARILTVMAGRDETVKDISVRYVGHFDDQLLQEIRNLNPSLNDPDHLGDGQLIQIPLRANTSIK